MNEDTKTKEQKHCFYLHLCNLTTFVISPQYSNPISKTNLQCHQECHRLQRVVTPIDIIPHK